ncbi:putative serine peptidase [Metarhizium anisopliae]
MRISFLAAVLAELLVGASAAGNSHKYDRRSHIPARSNNGTAAPKAGLFDQLIDHNNPSLGTFKQRFWWSADSYGGPGSPIILEAPGEAAVDENLVNHSNETLTGLFAQTNKAAAITLEHRYWGGSSPVGKNWTAQTLQHLNLDNSIQDLIYFANNVHLPFDSHGDSKPDKAPWVLTGCSYPGALTAWTNVLAPGTFWAYHASSAVVQAVSTFWEYFSPIEQAMPRNCSSDFKRLISHVDDVLFNGTTHQKQELKALFNSSSNTSDSNFANVLSSPLGDWQSTHFTSGYTNFSQMCDYVENQWSGSNVSIPGPEGVGTQRALEGFAKWMRERNSTSEDQEASDEPLWMWFLCNEPFEWWQVWGPGSDNGLVSKALTRDSSLADCKTMFPTVGNSTYGLNKGRTVDQLNRKTGGWNHVNTTRLMWVNGEYDPWTPATVSSKSRPGGPLKSTKQAPVWVIPKAAHCNDLDVRNRINEGAREVIDGVVSQMQEWVADYYKKNGTSLAHGV